MCKNFLQVHTGEKEGEDIQLQAFYGRPGGGLSPLRETPILLSNEALFRQKLAKGAKTKIQKLEGRNPAAAGCAAQEKGNKSIQPSHDPTMRPPYSFWCEAKNALSCRKTTGNAHRGKLR
jgi:hypothetical protein